MRVLAVNSCCEASGPTRSIENLVRTLENRAVVDVVTFARGEDRVGMLDVRDCDKCSVAERNKVMYGHSWLDLARKTLRAIRDGEYDVLYLNSMFSTTTISLLLLRWLGILPSIPILLAPRGEFDTGALATKRLKKRAFFLCARMLHLYDQLHWQATSSHEVEHIRNGLQDKLNIEDPTIWMIPNVGANVLALGNEGWIDETCSKSVGILKVAFVGRIVPNKNLLFALSVLSMTQCKIDFSISGRLSDSKYWKACQSAMRTLPSHVTVEYRGVLPEEEVIGALKEHHVMFLPTKFENFGHAIVEALLAGCIVLTTDRTPWVDLEEEGVGWSLPLEAGHEVFAAALDVVGRMPQETFEVHSRKAREYALRKARMDEVSVQYLNAFNAIASA
jgi:glycosyltransferase involved in cell wall biosynthesis